MQISIELSLTGHNEGMLQGVLQNGRESDAWTRRHSRFLNRFSGALGLRMPHAHIARHG